MKHQVIFEECSVLNAEVCFRVHVTHWMHTEHRLMKDFHGQT